MGEVISEDGTAIVFERIGDGVPLIVVGGALCDRAVMRPLAESLSRRFGVINYDRRGRGDSGDTQPYAVEREIEDLGALLAAAGGTAAVYGHSSGAGLVLRAAAQGLPFSKIILHEPPFDPDDQEMRQASEEAAENIRKLLSEGRDSDALEAHMTGTGMPQEMVAQMRAEPWWASMEANAQTLTYDYAIMDPAVEPADIAAAVAVPALVLSGGAGPDWMIEVCQQIANALPQGRLEVLEGQEHVVPPEILTPVLAEFLA
jgi:pimeloyl-ACP methyl ester carboxylesterase